MDVLKIEMPYPPTVNNYYIHTRRGVILGSKGRAYHAKIACSCLKMQNSFDKQDKIHLDIEVYPPDRRKRDISNLLKCIEDSLQYAKVFQDDYQINSISIARKEIVKGGKIIASLNVI